MNNQEAIVLGTVKFLDNNRDLVLKAIEKAVNNSLPEIAAAVGIQMSARLARFLNENRDDFVKVGKEMLAKEVLTQFSKRQSFDKDPAFIIPETKEGQ